MPKDIPVITVDGPSGSGKGALSAMIAKAYNWNFLDSGALFRMLALSIINNNIDLSNFSNIGKLAKELDADFINKEDGSSMSLLNNEDVSIEIRLEKVSSVASKIAVLPEVRAALLIKQKNFKKPPGLVADGRDMGTEVFPEAIAKIFLNASIEERAKRRYLQLKSIGENVTLQSLIEVVKERDLRDMQRSIAPLKPAAEAIIIDTTGISLDEVFALAIQKIEQHLSSNKV